MNKNIPILLILVMVFSYNSEGRNFGKKEIYRRQTNDGKGAKKPLKSIKAAERLKLKNAAFCECMYNSFPDSVFQNEGSLAGYVELGRYSFKAYETMMELAKKKSQIKYNSKSNQNLAIMKCLDFYNSKELDSLVRKLDPELHIEE
ncbi:MAG: T6SS amidase immunity protein Tai4 family protein [Bacteroidota bacterium]